MYLDNERRPTLTPQLAFRVAVLGGVALMAFAVIFFRLWYLQVLSGTEYREQARGNVIREIKVQAPRGQIVDRNGAVLVDNRNGLALVVKPDALPEDAGERREVYERLGEVLDMKSDRIERRAERDLRALPYSSATVRQDVTAEVAAYVLERQDKFPGVDVEQQFVRKYPHGEIGAHLFGTVGEVTEEQLADSRYNGVELGDRIGQSGIEAQYDRFLRGRNGASRVQVDAFGNIIRDLATKRPEQGRQLRLSLDLDVQEAGQQALAGGTGRGAFAVMDVNSGEVVALGSQPSFDPNIFTKPVPEKVYARLQNEDLGAPIFNRATQGGYPTGSTFKLVTAVAALEEGVITPEEIVNDGGVLTVGTQEFKNAGDAVNGPIDMRTALTVSSDVYFYKLGMELDSHGDRLGLQRWARRLGVGHKTGIDLPDELPGRIPTPAWRNAGNRAFNRCKDRKKPTDAQLSEGICGFFDRPWSVGDNINLSVGQGDIAANPLQMAVAYATVANGGKVLRPRLGLRIEDSSGRVIQELEAPTARRVNIDAPYRQAILDGIFGAANDANGTSTSVFEGFPIQVAGKTGTAEKGLFRPDQSWYVALAPYPNPRYVVAVTDEAGGFGAETAAPMARRIIAELFDIDENTLVAGGESPD
jgi:penicillin-binding protein 2